jgi:ribose transport system permease protein
VRLAVSPQAGTADPDAALPAQRKRRRRAELRGELAQRYGMLGILLLMVLVFSALRPDTFATVENLQSIINNQAVLILIALAAMVPLIVGGFDLSISASLSLASVLVVGLQGEAGIAWPLAVAMAVGAGLVIGLANGLLVALGKLNSFVVTLATQTVVAGLILLYTDGQVLFADVDPAFLSAGRDEVAGFVQPLFLALGVAAVLWYLLEHTPAGRQMYATGSNLDAARLTGIRTETLTVLAFVVAGGLAALAGVVQSARIASGQPDIGASYLLPAFAAAFLGASAIRIGRFNAIGTVLGVLLVATGFSGLVLLGVDLWVQPVFYGAVLLIAIGAPRLAESRSARRRPVEAEPT